MSPLKGPTVPEAINTKEITEVLEVIIEPPQVNPHMVWKMFVNGAKNRLGAGVVLKSIEEAIFENCLELNFLAMNNKAKYEAFIAGL